MICLAPGVFITSWVVSGVAPKHHLIDCFLKSLLYLLLLTEFSRSRCEKEFVLQVILLGINICKVR